MSTDALVISARKLRANRRNAQNSTGPRTDSGKDRSSRNAVAHGLFCKSLILNGEDPQHLRDLQIDLLKSLNPRNALELSFVQQIISATWRIKRVPAAEAAIFVMQQGELDQKLNAECKKREDALMMKLGAARFADRAAIQSELEAFRREVRNNPPQPRPVGELLAMLLSNKESPAGAALDRLHRHEQRLAGTITRGLKHLRDLRECGSDVEPSELTCAMLVEVGEENLQNEPTDAEHEANPQLENDLGENETNEDQELSRDTGFQPVPAALEEERSELLIGSSTG